MKSLLTLFMLLSALGIYSQRSVYETVPRNTDKYEKKILRKAKRLSCYNTNADYSIFFIYNLKVMGNRLSPGNGSDILSNLEFIYINGKNCMPSNEAIVYDDSLEVVAYSDDLHVTCNYEYPSFNKLIKYAFENESDFLFRISGSNGMIYFSLEDSNLQVLVIEQESLNVYTLSEFANCCWDTLRL